MNHAVGHGQQRFRNRHTTHICPVFHRPVRTPVSRWAGIATPAPSHWVRVISMAEPISSNARTVHNVALAYFERREHISDATRDLCSAGFSGSQINISDRSVGNGGARQPLVDAIGLHSLRWQLNRAHTHDRQRRGADQINGHNPMPSEAANPTCWTLDLAPTLLALGVSPDIIALLQRDSASKGMFMLVDAADRVPDANAILSGNAGFLRTQYLRGRPV